MKGKTAGIVVVLSSVSREGSHCERHLSPFKNHKDHSTLGLVPLLDAVSLPFDRTIYSLPF